MKINTLLTLVLPILLIGCFNQETSPNNKVATKDSNSIHTLSELELKKAKDSVRSLMRSYNEAMDSLDAEKILTHFRDSPDFVYKRKGNRIGYEDFVKGNHNLEKSFIKIDCSYDSLYVDVISHDVAIATVAFDETITNVENKELDIKGTMSWIARKENGNWKFIHGMSYSEF